jgi:hypothetical protein
VVADCGGVPEQTKFVCCDPIHPGSRTSGPETAGILGPRRTPVWPQNKLYRDTKANATNGGTMALSVFSLAGAAVFAVMITSVWCQLTHQTGSFQRGPRFCAASVSYDCHRAVIHEVLRMVTCNTARVCTSLKALSLSYQFAHRIRLQYLTEL